MRDGCNSRVARGGAARRNSGEEWLSPDQPSAVIRKTHNVTVQECTPDLVPDTAAKLGGSE